MCVHCYLSIVCCFKPFDYNNKYNYRLQWENKLQKPNANINARVSEFATHTFKIQCNPFYTLCE